MEYSNKNEIEYIIYLLNQILSEPKPTKTIQGTMSGGNYYVQGDSLKVMYRKLHKSVSINIPIIIKLLNEIKK